MRLSLLLTLTSLALLAPCAEGQSVKVNWRSRIDFSTYKTYAWKVSPHEQRSFYLPWVRRDVDAILRKQGLTRAAAGERPDLYLSYHFLTQEVMDSTTTSDGFGFGEGDWMGMGGYGGWGMGMGDDMGGGDMMQTEATPRSMGILTLDFADAKKNELIWRGQATEDSVSNSQKGDEKQVLKSVDKMMKQFPPKKK